ncbi:WGR domain-containing protein [Kitasatospora phosalacinea]|uniref:WGR domain-containing protein n=1 Tax=Kitasatospora phosalacinea TaxID=2065 RepID=UPI00068CF249|nr:WGR domain-containing protein [Kitasatospora phosalacinea]
MQRWELVGGGSAKFWEGGAEGAAVRVRYGRIGTEGRSQVKELADAAAAAAHLAKLVAEKERKGYLAVDGGGEDGGADPAGAAVVVPAVPAVPVEPAGLPDEDGFVLPEAWRARVLPRRRGGVPVPLPVAWPVVDAAEAAAAEARQVAERHGAIEQVLTAPGSDPGPVAAARAYLDGELDPAGLVAVAAMVRERDELNWMEREFAGWVARFGLGFAARAAVASFEVDDTWVQPNRWRTRLTARHLDGPDLHALLFEFLLLALARRVLAAAPDNEYASAVKELATLRDTPVRRAATAFLVPERAEWVDECLAELSGHGPGTTSVLRTLLLSAIGSPEQARRLALALKDDGARVHWTPQVVATLADGVGTAAAPLVAAALEQYAYDYDDTIREYARYVAEFPTDEAMGELVDRITAKPVRLVLLDLAERFPVRAVRVLSAAARRGGATGDAARRLLNRHVAVLRPRLPEVLARLDGEDAAFVLGLAGAREPLPEAAPERLPALLVDPPWARRRAARPPKVLTGLTADEGAELYWEEGESAAFAATAEQYWQYPADTDWAAEAQRTGALDSPWQCCRLLAQAPAETMAPYLDSWDAKALAEDGVQLLPVLAKYGTAALRLVHGAVLARPAQTVQVLLPVRGAVAAGVMADALVRLKSAQEVARSWFERHGVAGALLLVPAAVGKTGRARTAAESALRLVAVQQGAEVLTAAVAERYGEQAAEMVAEVVAEALRADPLETALPAKLPELPSWLRPEVLPQIQLADGSGALPLQAVHHLLTVLQLGKLREPYPGLALVAPALRADSAAAFCWALFEEWQQAGMPGPDRWVLYALGEFGDDDTARRLAPLLREWPGQNAHQRAVEGLDVLAAIGTDAALWV